MNLALVGNLGGPEMLILMGVVVVILLAILLPVMLRKNRE